MDEQDRLCGCGYRESLHKASPIGGGAYCELAETRHLLTAQAQEIEQLKAALKALADKVDATSECDHHRLSCAEIGCIGVEVKAAREALAGRLSRAPQEQP